MNSWSEGFCSGLFVRTLVLFPQPTPEWGPTMYQEQNLDQPDSREGVAEPGPAGFKEGSRSKVPSLTTADNDAEQGFEPTAVTGPGLSSATPPCILSASYSLAPAKLAGCVCRWEGTNFCCDLPEPKLPRLLFNRNWSSADSFQPHGL